MAKSLKVSDTVWQKLYRQIYIDYPPSVLLIRERMRKTLGFTVRNHVEYPEGMYRSTVYLDFYDEPKRTMFLLKYGDLLDETTT